MFTRVVIMSTPTRKCFPPGEAMCSPRFDAAGVEGLPNLIMLMLSMIIIIIANHEPYLNNNDHTTNNRNIIGNR